MTKTNLPSGYRFAGLHCGIKESGRPDLALIVSDTPAVAAGVFTQNRVVAAPVQWCRQRLPQEKARGVVINSGNANACTGEQGLKDTRRMAELAAVSIGCLPEQILVCSTGVIGVPLPMPRIEKGIHSAAKTLGATEDHLHQAAESILTTDTCIKVRTRVIDSAEGAINVTGIAKGAAMIGPNMATMLAFVLTDAAVAADDLSMLAREVAAKTFNCISVDGHTSTNDTLLFLANKNGTPLAGPARKHFEEAVFAVCAELAQDIIADAEGAEHLIRIDVEGLRSDDEAKAVAKTVADSALVKTAVFGADPNWGRFVSAAGYAGVEFGETDLSLWLGEFLLYKNGSPQSFDNSAASAYMKRNRDVCLRLQFALGTGKCTFWTSDLTYDYVRLNAEYTT